MDSTQRSTDYLGSPCIFSCILLVPISVLFMGSKKSIDVLKDSISILTMLMDALPMDVLKDSTEPMKDLIDLPEETMIAIKNVLDFIEFIDTVPDQWNLYPIN